MKYLSLLSSKEKKYIIITCVIFAFSSMFLAFRTYITASIISFAENKDIKGCIYTASFSLGLFFLDLGLDAILTKVRVHSLFLGEVKIKNNIMRNMLNRPTALFKEKDDSYWINLLSGDVDSYKNGVISIIPYIIYAIVSLSFVSVILILLSPMMFIIGSLLAVIPLFFMKPISNYQSKLRKNLSDANESYHEILKESIVGYETFKMMGVEEAYLRFSSATISKGEVWKRGCFSFNFSSQLFVQLAGLSHIICLFVGTLLVINGNLSLAMLYASSSYFSQLSNQANNLVDNLVELRSMERIVKKLLSEISCSVVSNSHHSNKMYDIDFKNVSFCFNDRKIISDFSYKFKKLGCYAIIGESGCGKSTLIHLIMKWFENYDGKIYLGTYNIKQLSERDIYESIGVVEQRPHIFNATFFENITMFRKDIKCTDADYREVVKALNLESVENNTKNSLLGDFGERLSGGEKQRIAIARTMLHHPSILIMDEPTTGLDPENTAIINEFIFQQKGITKIIITHDLRNEYISKYDAILKIDNGVIKELNFNKG